MHALGIEHFALFVVSGLMLNLVPGPDALYIMRNGLRMGARGGAMAAAGILGGCLVHVAGAALGLSALLAASSAAFNAVKWLGAAYLLWMGWQLLRARPNAWALDASAVATVQRAGLARVFWGGFATNVLNPKVALFFLAFVPQFISDSASHKSLSFLVLGVIFVVNSAPICLAWGFGAAWLARHLARSQRLRLWLDRASGTLFIAFGLRLALFDPSAR